jgi:hypothetical protein
MINSRRAVALLEAIAAAALLAVLVTVCLRMFALTALERRAVEKRAIAMQEAANAIESVAALPWDQVTPERLAEIELSPSVKEILPGGALKLSVEPATTGPPGTIGPQGKHVRVELTWTNATGGVDAPVRLAYWAYPRPGASP